MVMFIAGLLNIPDVFHEAAKIDGGGFWRRLIHITLPLLKNTRILVFVSCATTCARLALALWCPSALVARQLPPIRHSTCLLIKPAMPRAQ